MPETLSGVMRNAFYIAHDQLFQRKAESVARQCLPLDFINEHYSFFCQTGVTVAKHLRLPVILDDIAPIWEEETYYRRDLQRIARRIQASVFEQASEQIAMSGVIQDCLISSGVNKERIHIVGNGADCDFFRPEIGGRDVRKKYRLDDRIVLGFVGSFAPWHGVDLLIESARDLVADNRNIHFLIVGDGPRRAELEQRVQEYKLGSYVTFTGAVPIDQVPPFLDAMDITVVPNTTAYCSPIKLFEYMAMEKVTIAPRFSPIEEVVCDGVDGMLFPAGDRDALSHTVFTLMDDRERRREIGKAARQKILSHYTWSARAEALCKIASSPHDQTAGW